MKRITLTFAISSLILGILFFAYQANGKIPSTVTEHNNFLQKSDTASRTASNSEARKEASSEDTDAQPIRFLNDGN